MSNLLLQKNRASKGNGSWKNYSKEKTAITFGEECRCQTVERSAGVCEYYSLYGSIWIQIDTSNISLEDPNLNSQWPSFSSRPIEWRIYASVNSVIISSDNSVSPVRRRAIIWLSIEQRGANFSSIWINILSFSFTKRHLRISHAKWRSFCLGLNVLTGHKSLSEPMMA